MSVLQQIVAVATAFVLAALIGGVALALTHCIPIVRGVGRDRRVEDRIAVRSSVSATLFECCTTVFITRCGNVLAVLGCVTPAAVHSKEAQAQDSGYAYNSLHDPTLLPLAQWKMKALKQSLCPLPCVVGVSPTLRTCPFWKQTLHII
jgi:hypothetical protein